uniref:Lipoprotein n=1 Tax=Nitratidesulfovibrio vulgaris (strain DSM 19637 / Miyazaki F) TaxID=883 RepID=B8DP73_NITV9
MLTLRRYGVGFIPSGPRYLLFLPLLLLALLVSACAPLTRGVSGKDVVSSSRPPVVVRPAAGFDLLGSGAASPVLDTELGLRHADVGWAFYADVARERQLAVVLSETPDGWQWELDVSSPWHEVRRDVYATGPARFAGATFLMPASADPFALMLPAPPAQHADEGQWRWLVRRYTQLFDFRAVKLVVEYREPIPAGVGEQLADALDAGQQPAGRAAALLGEFEARSRAAFSVLAYPEGGLAAEGFAHDSSRVHVRKLAGMAGRMEPIRNLPSDDK